LGKRKARLEESWAILIKLKLPLSMGF